MKSIRIMRILLLAAIFVVLTSACAPEPAVSTSTLAPANAGAEAPLPTETLAADTATATAVTTAPTAAAQSGKSSSTTESAPVYSIQSAVSSDVLTDSASGQNGAPIEQQPYNGTREQQWNLVSLDSSGSLFLIQSVDGARCLDSVGGAENQEGTFVLLTTCDQSDGQKWQQIPCSDTAYACQHAPGAVWLSTPANGRVLDLPNDSKAAGEKINTLAIKHGGMNQLWYLQPVQ
jgi:hypothetical protein